MTAAVEPGGAVFVLIALRADFYPRCAPYADLREAPAAQQAYLGPTSADALRVRGAPAPGGVRGAIAEPADDVLRDHLDPGQQAIARNIFLRLTQVADEEGMVDTP